MVETILHELAQSLVLEPRLVAGLFANNPAARRAPGPAQSRVRNAMVHAVQGRVLDVIGSREVGLGDGELRSTSYVFISTK